MNQFRGQHPEKPSFSSARSFPRLPPGCHITYCCGVICTLLCSIPRRILSRKCLRAFFESIRCRKTIPTQTAETTGEQCEHDGDSAVSDWRIPALAALHKFHKKTFVYARRILRVLVRRAAKSFDVTNVHSIWPDIL